ncbi:MAG: sensor histidine kinase [bacterium]
MSLIGESSVKNDGGILLLAATRLVFLNTIRAVPHYSGAFIIGEEVKDYYQQSSLVILLVPFLIIPGVYLFINLFYNINYNFGGPAFLSIFIIIFIYIATKNIEDITAKIIIITIFLFGFQWLDVMPLLTPFYFGRGELSLIVKDIGIIINAENLLNFFGFIFWFILTLSALIISRMVISHYRRIEAVKEKRNKEVILEQMRLKRIEDRADKEMRYLVHDLKTPLTTIQGLNDVIKYISSNSKVRKHTEKIDNAAGSMNNIISEIMNKDQRSFITIKKLEKMLKKQLAGEKFNCIININNQAKGKIYVNKMRLIRAIVNLVDNSIQAVKNKYDEETDKLGKIFIDFIEKDKYLLIKVSDNGTGLEEDRVKKVSSNHPEGEKGENTDNQFVGLGIEFVKKVLKENEGIIVADSDKGVGTTIYLYIPLQN